MTAVSNLYSPAQAAGSNQKLTAENKTEKKEEGLWESFCNEVLAPTLEDAAYNYIDDNFGTNLVEQKEQEELEATYEEILAEDEAKQNQSLWDGLGDIIGEVAGEEVSKYVDKKFGTHTNEDLKEQKAKDAALLEEAKAYKAQKEAQESQGGIYNLLCSLFGINKKG